MSAERWSQTYLVPLAGFGKETKQNLTDFQRGLKVTKGDADASSELYYTYCRRTQVLAANTIRDLDAAGTPPREGRQLVDLMRKLLKYHLNSARACAEAVEKGDKAGLQRLIANESTELPPLQKALMNEVERLAPGTVERIARNSWPKGKSSLK